MKKRAITSIILALAIVFYTETNYPFHFQKRNAQHFKGDTIMFYQPIPNPAPAPDPQPGPRPEPLSKSPQW